jgi:hypothetical protein
MMKRAPRNHRKLAPVLLLCYAVGCLPDGAINQVLGENLLLSAAIAIQTITAQFFNTLFGVI